MSVLIDVRGVSKTFGGVVANDNISIQVPKGSITGLIGPNGSGKTTLFNSIVGYHLIDAGSIWFHGSDISKLRVQQVARRGLLRTFQQTRIYGQMNCIENMQISISHRNISFRSIFARQSKENLDRAEALLEFVGLFTKRRLLAGDLSFGQQKLLEFAMALMNEPQALLLDEPTASLDARSEKLVMEGIGKYTESTTNLMITHQLAPLQNVSQILVMQEGQIVQRGDYATLASQDGLFKEMLAANLAQRESDKGNLDA